MVNKMLNTREMICRDDFRKPPEISGPVSKKQHLQSFKFEYTHMPFDHLVAVTACFTAVS